MTDCHTHILPDMDDGSRSTEESVKMLRDEYAQGVRGVILTPHFYINCESAEEFLKRRSTCEERLRRAAESCADELPAISIGAEVRYFQGMSRMSGIEKLAVTGTPYMLTELPFDTWPDGVFRELEILRSSGIVPVIAHIERYMKFQKHTDNLKRLRNTASVLIQSNASFFIDRHTRRTALKMLKDGYIDIIASDCHRAEGVRTPNQGQAFEIIEKKAGIDAAERLRKNARMLFNPH